MGFLNASCQLLFHARKHLGVDYARTLTLGRQELFMDLADLRKLALAQGIGTLEQLKHLEDSQGYSEPLFELLGAKRVDSMDASGYEQATIVHDLNVPVPSALHNRFTCIVDGGTIEHVFHFPNAIKSCMDMLELGGHYIGITPANNQMGHGFYQFSPELYFRVFGAANGFEVRTMLVRAAKDWYEVTDPETLGERTEFVNSLPVSLIVVARKCAVVGEFHTPQQSDYAAAWRSTDPARSNERRLNEGAVHHLARKVLPTSIKTWLNRVNALTKSRVEIEGLGTVRTKHFKRVDLQ